MSDNTNVFDALEQAVETNDELKDALIEIQRNEAEELYRWGLGSERH